MRGTSVITKMTDLLHLICESLETQLKMLSSYQKNGLDFRRAYNHEIRRSQLQAYHQFWTQHLRSFFETFALQIHALSLVLSPREMIFPMADSGNGAVLWDHSCTLVELFGLQLKETFLLKVQSVSLQSNCAGLLLFFKLACSTLFDKLPFQWSLNLWSPGKVLAHSVTEALMF
mmetsp:Transcript_18614/g.24050  ORF Transcript_18614/g.24050 Transcript_18614/m.24050 type:complete len:174 (+) Transcript_18614:313-834(+)